ncbi:MAG TPA: response regulator transcription factor [Verrucomicrobiae bacterium]|nr:response regulator transcription factor [Verrucomicrobiae bacterium]
MRILLIEDSRHLQHSVSTALRKSGYAVDVSGDGAEGLWYADSNQYDAIILDLMLPGMDGLTLLRRLRAQGRETHVLILTARDTVADRVRGLQAGADDYLIKPFALEELLARVQALCRRGYGRKSQRLRIGDLEIDLTARTVTRAGAAIDLTAREYRLLEYLMLRRGEVVSRSEIEEHIYSESADPLSNVVDSAICTLRRKITPHGKLPLIATKRGLGYVLDAPSK